MFAMRVRVVARRSAEVGGVLGRNDQPEVMAVVLASLGEGAIVGGIGPGVEHPRRLALTGDAVAFEIGAVGRERGRAEARTAMTDDPRLDQDAARGAAQAGGGRRGATPAECRAARTDAEPRADMPGLLGGAEHLIDEGLGSAAPAVAGPARSKPQLVVAHTHAEPEKGLVPSKTRQALNLPMAAARRHASWHAKTLTKPTA